MDGIKYLDWKIRSGVALISKISSRINLLKNGKLPEESLVKDISIDRDTY